ncbi:MAG: hypothetical protein JST92_00235 [Deltaproteobacteria bacterium]|nr:hypothetical protein [Deltaproteobacteria bacterium]
MNPTVGIPIGALTARLVANLALAGLDQFFAKSEDVLHYRRYVDDIIVVERWTQSEPPAEALTRLFPMVTTIDDAIRFIDPLTGASLELNAAKTRLHELKGRQGVEFLGAVKDGFSVVASERRAMLADAELLGDRLERIDVFGQGGDDPDETPHLRTADRYTLKRFTETAFIKGLDRAVLLGDQADSSRYIRKQTRTVLGVLDANPLFQSLEFAIGILRAAVGCACSPVVKFVENWLRRTLIGGLRQGRNEVPLYWNSYELDGEKTRRALTEYLERRIQEVHVLSSVGALADPSLRRTRRQASEADLRHFDRLSDAPRLAPDRRGWQRDDPKLTDARRMATEDAELERRLRLVDTFLAKCKDEERLAWATIGSFRVFLSTRPPAYLDVARVMLADLETASAQPDVSSVAKVVNALRSTAYPYQGNGLSLKKFDDRNAVLSVQSRRPPRSVRVILGNLLASPAEFEAAANGTPLVSSSRLSRLDKVLRAARPVAAAASAEGIPSLLVLPELSVPRRYHQRLAHYAQTEDLSIVAGLEYRTVGSGVQNQAIGIFPARYGATTVVGWTKRHPAHSEGKALGSRFLGPSPRHRRQIVDTDVGRLAVLICSELFEVDALADVRGQMEYIVVPAWNEDTNSYDHLAHAVSNLLTHAFVCIANNASYSDARIVAPVKEPRYQREWCRLILRNEGAVVWGDLPIEDLRRVHERKTRTQAKPIYRPLPPGWD